MKYKTIALLSLVLVTFICSLSAESQTTDNIIFTGVIKMRDGETPVSAVGMKVGVTVKNITKDKTYLLDETNDAGTYQIACFEFLGVCAEVGDEISIIVDSTEYPVEPLTADNITPPFIVTRDVTTEIPFQTKELTVSGSVLYKDGVTPLNLEVTVTVANLAKGVEAIGVTDASGNYSILLSAEETVAEDGDVLVITVTDAGNEIGTVETNLLTAQEIMDKAVAAPPVVTIIGPSTTELTVTGTVYYNDMVGNILCEGQWLYPRVATPVGEGLNVTVENSAKGVSASGTTDANGNFSIFLDGGQIVGEYEDILVITITDAGGVVVGTVDSNPLTTQQVMEDKAAAAPPVVTDITPPIISTDNFIITGVVSNFDMTPAAGVEVTVQNVTKDKSYPPDVTNDAGIYQIACFEFGGVCGETGDEMSISVNGNVERIYKLPTIDVERASHIVTVDVILTGPPDPVQSELPDALPTITADGFSTVDIVIGLNDQNCKIVDDAVVEVNLAPEIGAVGDVMNIGDGTYSFTYTAGKALGDVVLTVVADGVEMPPLPPITLTSPEIVEVTADPTAIPADGASASQITTTLQNLNGEPVPGLDVQISIADDSEIKTGELSAMTDNEDGTYTATYTAGNDIGDVTLVVTALDSTATVTITLIPPITRVALGPPVDETPSPDSGALTGVVNLNALTTPDPAIQSVEIQIFNDETGEWDVLGTVTESVPIPVEFEDTDELLEKYPEIYLSMIQGAIGDILSGGAQEPIGTVPQVWWQWVFEWDTTTVDDTITHHPDVDVAEDEGRNYVLDANFPPGPYMLRAVVDKEGELVYSPAAKASVDNIDDVPPLQGTEIVEIIRQEDVDEFSDNLLPADAPEIYALFRVVAEAQAAPETYEKLVLLVNSVDGTFSKEYDLSNGYFEINTWTEEMANGEYTLQALAEDASGNREVADPAFAQTIVIANMVPPLITDVALVQTGDQAIPLITLDAPVNLRPASGLSMFEANILAGRVWLLISQVPLGWSVPADIDIGDPNIIYSEDIPRTNDIFEILWDASPLETGTYYVSLVFHSGPINIFTYPMELIGIETIVDNTNPTIELIVPTSGRQNQVILATYQDEDSEIYSITVSIQDENGNVVNDVNGRPALAEAEGLIEPALEGEVPGAGATYAGPLEGAFGLSIDSGQLSYRIPALDPGSYTVVLEVTDLARNVEIRTEDLLLQELPDTTPPLITAFSPQGTIGKSVATITVVATDESGIDPESVKIKLNGTELNVDSTGVKGGVATIVVDVADLQAGMQQVGVELADYARNSTTFKWTFTVELPPLDTTPPQITVVSPQGIIGGAMAQGTVATTIIVSATDESGIKSISIKLDDRDAVDLTVEDGTVENGVAMLKVEDLTSGEHIVETTVTDVADNTAQAKWSFVVELIPAPPEDTTPPQITVVSPQGTIKTPTATIIVSATDESGIGSVSVKLDEGDAVDATLDGSVATLTVDGLTDGEHSVEVTVADAAATPNTAQAKWSFIVELPPGDTTPPQITSVSPLGTIYENNVTLLVSATDESGMADDVAFVLNGTDVAGTLAGGAQATAEAGENTVKATVTDTVGNEATVQWTFNVVLDETPPIITSFSPQGTIYENSVTLLVGATDESGVRSSVTFKLDGTTRTGTLSNGYTARNLTDGEHKVEATVTDNAGNKATARWSFMVLLDNTPPVITSFSPQGTIYEDSVTLFVSATDDRSGMKSSVTFKLDGTTRTGTLSGGYNATGLDDGEHKVEATVTDNANNKATAQWSFMVLLDNNPPVITATAPHGLIRVEKPALSATAVDDMSGVDSISISLEDAGGKKVTVKKASTGDSSVTFEPSSALKAGTYTAMAEASDNAGNSSSAQWSFTVEFDVIPPVVTIISPQDGVRMTERKPVISATYSDNLAGVDPTSVKLTVDGQSVTAKATETQVTYTPADDLDIGPHTVVLNVSDNDDNEATQEWSFVVEYEKGLIMNARNYPNPFPGNTKIAFLLSKQAQVTIKIFDFSGRLVNGTLADNELMEAGLQDIAWDGKSEAGDDLTSGVYFCLIIMKTDELEAQRAVLRMALSR